MYECRDGHVVRAMDILFNVSLIRHKNFHRSWACGRAVTMEFITRQSYIPHACPF